MTHQFTFEVFEMSSGERMEVVHTPLTSEKAALRMAWDFVGSLNEEHAAGSPHTVECHEGVPRRYRATILDCDGPLGTVIGVE